MICLLLAAILVLSGCGSIVMSENLQFEVNPPITPLSGEAWLGGGGRSDGSKISREEAAENIRFAYGSMEKYGIDGARAFTILPGHVSPADVPSLNEIINNTNANLKADDQLDLYVGDFKVLGYDEETERFVYAYYTPYIGDGVGHTDDRYPEVGNTGLSVAKTGNVGTGFVTARPDKISDISGMVLVVMSYAPGTGDYTVFFSKVFTMEEHKTNDMRMLAGKVAGRPYYYVYVDDYMYLYDSDGEKQYTSSYSAIVQSKALYMIKNEVPKHNNIYIPQDATMIQRSGYYELGFPFASVNSLRLGVYFRWTVADVEMDENFMPYITLNLEYSFKDFAAADKESDDIVNNDEEVEDSDDGALDGAGAENIGDITYFHGTFACLRIAVDESGMRFLSEISEDSLKALGGDELTVVQEVSNYSDVRGTVTETTVQTPESVPEPIPESSPDDTGDQTVTYTAGSEDVQGEDTLQAETVRTERPETYDETLQRLIREYTDNPPDDEKKQYFIDKYLSNESVNKALNDFSVFDTQLNPGISGIYFALGGGSTGRSMSFYDANGIRQGGLNFPTPNYYGGFIDWSRRSLLSQYLECVGDIASTANSSGHYVPFLKPGRFGEPDWAYYDVEGYHERNGSYSLTGTDYITGHAQPLVSSELYMSDIYNVRNTARRSIYYVIPDEEGILHCTTVNGYEIDEPGFLDSDAFGDSWNFYKGMNQYYYNGCVGDGFTISLYDGSMYDNALTSAYTNSRVHEINKLHYYLPYVLAYHETYFSDGRSVSEYATIQNDKPGYILPTMVLEETEDITLTCQYVLADDTGTRSDVYYQTTCDVTIPAMYRMVFPAGSYIQISGDVWIGNMVKAENQLGAITYYTTNGSRLYSDAVWNWNLRYKYPIYDNASGRTLDASSEDYYCTYAGWLQWYFLRSNAFWNFYNENSDKYFSTLQVNHQGSGSVIYDRLVPGQAQDLGVWNVNGKNYVAYFTDQVIRFYEYNENEKKYRATAQISIDELQMLSEGYFLREKTDGWVESVSSSGSESVSNIAEEAMNDDDTRISLNSDNIMPISGGLSRFLYFSEAGSLYLMTLLKGVNDGVDEWQKHGRLMPLMDGTYYRVFDTNESYKVVGFQTSSFSYVAADQCMARVYDIDIDALVKARADESVNMYLENLRNIYLSDNHTLLRTVTEVAGDGNSDKQYEVSYSIVPPDTTDPEYSRALRLFTTESMDDALNELQLICNEYKVDRSQGMEAKLKELRDNLQAQRKALREMYNLLGINFIGLPTSWQYIQYEGYLYNASHQSILETMMVQIVLSDDYLDKSVTPQLNGFDGLIGLHTYDPNTDTGDVRFLDNKYTGGEKIVDEFAEYREQYRLWLQSSQGDIDSLGDLDGENMSQLLVTTYNGEYITEITAMDFYDKVLDEIKETYLRSLN